MICILFFLLFGFFTSNGQDSIPKEDHVRHTYQKKVRIAAMSGNFEQALIYADSVCFFAKKNKNIRDLLVGQSLKGKVCEVMGDKEKAYDFFQQALGLLDNVAAKDFDENFTVNNTKANIYEDLMKLFHRHDVVDSMYVYCDKIKELTCDEGVLSFKDYAISLLGERRDFKKALKTCQEVLSCYQVSPKYKHLLPQILLRMAKTYSALGEHETAIAYLDSTLQVAEEVKDSFYIMLSYEQLGLEFSGMNNHEEALDWHRKCVQMAEKMPRHINIKRVSTRTIILPLGVLYANLSQAYDNVNKIDSAKYYTQKSLAISYESRRLDNVASQLVHLANFMIAEGSNYDTALDSLDKAYQIAPRYREWLLLQLDIYLTKGKIYTELNKIDSALSYYAKAEETAEELGVDNKLAATYRKIEAFYLDQKNYKKAYDYQTLKVEQERKMKDRDRQNSVLSFEIKYESEKLEQENLLLAKTQVLQAKELAFKETLNQRNSYIILGLIVLILLLIGIAWLVYRQKNLQTQFKIMTLEQKALKAQINPHFFFNVLNSLQGTILSEKPMVAYKYHAKFTKLMRLILLQSNSDGILLEEELEALQLYLELEQLRTGSAFDFEIINKVDLKDEIIVPSMLLQPFVENSIWHGVMNRKVEEDKKIIVRIHKKDKRIVCEIEDTGVGRQQAEQIKKQKTTTYESMGMEVTQNRLELFQLRYKTPLMFNIEDLKGAADQILGTKVNLEIPIIK